MDFRIRMCDGKWPNKYYLGKYYIQFTNKRGKWRNYKDNEWVDDWKSTVYYEKEKDAIDKVAEMIKDNLDKERFRQEAMVYKRDFNMADIAKILLEEG